ncbi:hypothetical protein MPTK1_7g07260 [Marchantia polymorpha subsp. ruderalis]|uniref:Uncharacterized protein n=2 Tax=Marchantia polymorpha TaxID=3197 RepID=A0AAF6BX10_MARPO|nr:hypothetical protein MARPO_0076s0068 [Marchantia polymorpha]BBN16544.1 hypothetical protein Mp_7g07260 [Marchantia polymorpha subsp. ruderalis]|eukprot:PTQ34834.1 hypothetical protein MARPO_0076s0068 [Marchantia polymorpha]
MMRRNVHCSRVQCRLLMILDEENRVGYLCSMKPRCTSASASQGTSQGQCIELLCKTSLMCWRCRGP